MDSADATPKRGTDVAQRRAAEGNNMKTCVLCGNKAGWFPKKSYSGCVCKDCLSLIPQGTQLSSADTDFLKTIIDKTTERKKRFKCTAFYGALFIDEVNNMFCISKRQQGGVPLRFGDIYYITELKEVGLYCTNVKNVSSRVPRIVCDVKIRVKTDDAFMEYLIVSGETCSFKRTEDGIEWYEPAKLSMFRNLFNQMIENEVFGAWRKLEAIRKMEAELSEIHRFERWARGVFFFREDDEVTNEAIKKRRNMLVKLFHPDVGFEFASEEIMAQINEAFQLLTKDNQNI